MRAFGRLVLVCGLVLGVQGAALADKTKVSLGTATKGGGFEVFGGGAAQVINETDPTLDVMPVGTKGSRENIPLLEAGKLDTALVASLPAYEAFNDVGRAPTDLKIITAIYSTFGMFAVRGDSPAASFRDLVGKPVAWGTKSSGLTLLGKYVSEALGLDRDKDFQAHFLAKAGDGAPMLLDGRIDGFWGGGVGWPGFVKAMKGGGRFVGLSAADVALVNAKHPFLKPFTLPAGSYEGQKEAVTSVASYSFLLARADLPDDVAYRLAKALHQGHGVLAGRLKQARETTPENTVIAAPTPGHIHPGVRRYLSEVGIQ